MAKTTRTGRNKIGSKYSDYAILFSDGTILGVEDQSQDSHEIITTIKGEPYIVEGDTQRTGRTSL